MRKTILIGVLLLLGSVAPASWATALFESSSYAKLTYEGFTGPVGAGSVEVSIFDLSVTPGGHVSANGNASGVLDEAVSTDGDGSGLLAGESVEVMSSVSGEAIDGDVSGASSVGGIFEVFNNFLDTVTLEFTLATSYDFTHGADPGDSATAFLEMLVVVYDLAGVVPDAYIVDLVLDSLLGDPSETSNGIVSQTLFVDLPVGGAFGIDLFLTSEGSAVAKAVGVPTPGVILLVVLGLGMLGVTRRVAA